MEARPPSSRGHGDYRLPDNLTLTMGKKTRVIDVREKEEIQKLWGEITTTGAFQYAIDQLHSMHRRGPPPAEICYTLSHRVSFHIKGETDSYDLTSLGIPEDNPELKKINRLCEQILNIMKASSPESADVSGSRHASDEVPARGRHHPTFAHPNFDLDALTLRVTALEHTVRTSRDAEDAAHARIADLEQDLGAGSSERDRLAGELRTNAGRLSTAQAATASSQANLRTAQDDLNTASRSNSGLQSELDRLQASNHALETTTREAQESTDRATQGLTNLRRVSEQTSAQLTAANARVRELEAELATLRTTHDRDFGTVQGNLAEAIAAREALQTQAASQQGEIQELTQQLTALQHIQHQLQTAQASIADLEEQLRTSRASLSQKTQQVANLNTEVATINATATTQLEQINTLTAANRDLSDQLATNQTETTRLRAALASGTSDSEDLRRQLTALGQANGDLHQSLVDNRTSMNQLQVSFETSEASNTILQRDLRLNETLLEEAQATANNSLQAQRAIESEIARLSAADGENRARIAALEVQLSGLTATNATQTAQLQTNQATIAQIQAELSATTSRSEISTQALQARLTALTERNEGLQGSLTTNEGAMIELQASLNRSQLENGALRTQLDESAASLAESQRRTSELEAETSTLRAQNVELQGRITQLEVVEREKEALTLANAELQSDLSRLSGELRSLGSAQNSALTDLERGLAITATDPPSDPAARLAAIQAKITEGDSLLADQAAALQRQQVEIASKEALVAQAEETMRTQSQRIESLRTQIAHLSGENTDLRARLEALEFTEKNNRGLIHDNERLLERVREMEASLSSLSEGHDSEISALELSLDIRAATSDDSSRIARIREALAEKNHAIQEMGQLLRNQAEELERVKRQLQVKTNVNKGLQSFGKKQSARITRLALATQDLRAASAGAAAQHTSLTQAISAIQSENAKLQAHIHQLDKTHGQTVHELRETLGSAETALARLTGDLSSQQAGIASIEAILGLTGTGDISSRFSAISGEMESLRGALAEQTDANTSLLEELRILRLVEEANQALSATNEELKLNLAEREARLEGLAATQEEVTQLRTVLAQYEAGNLEAQEVATSLKRQIGEKGTEIAELEGLRGQQSAELSALRDQLAELAGRLASSEESHHVDISGALRENLQLKADQVRLSLDYKELLHQKLLSDARILQLDNTNRALYDQLALFERTKDAVTTLTADKEKVQGALTAAERKLTALSESVTTELSKLCSDLGLTTGSGESTDDLMLHQIRAAVADQRARIESQEARLSAQERELMSLRTELQSKEAAIYAAEVVEAIQSEEITSLNFAMTDLAGKLRGSVAEIEVQSRKIGDLNAQLSIGGEEISGIRSELERARSERDKEMEASAKFRSLLFELQSNYEKLSVDNTGLGQNYVAAVEKAAGNEGEITRLKLELGKSLKDRAQLTALVTELTEIAAAKAAGDLKSADLESKLAREAEIKSHLNDQLARQDTILKGCYETVWRCMHEKTNPPEDLDISQLPKLIDGALNDLIHAAIEPERILREKEEEYARACKLLQDKEGYLQKLYDQISLLKKALVSAHETEPALEADLVAALSEITKLEQDVIAYREGAENLAKTLHAENDTLLAKLHDESQAKTALMKEKNTIETELRNLKEIVTVLKAAETMTGSKESGLATALASSNLELTRIESTLRELQEMNYPKTVRELAEAKQELQDDLSAKEKKVNSLRAELSTSRADTVKHVQMNTILETSLKASEHKIRKITDELSAVLTKNIDLQGRVSFLSTENAVQAELIETQALEVFALRRALAERSSREEDEGAVVTAADSDSETSEGGETGASFDRAEVAVSGGYGSSAEPTTLESQTLTLTTNLRALISPSVKAQSNNLGSKIDLNDLLREESAKNLECCKIIQCFLTGRITYAHNKNTTTFKIPKELLTEFKLTEELTRDWPVKPEYSRDRSCNIKVTSLLRSPPTKTGSNVFLNDFAYEMHNKFCINSLEKNFIAHMALFQKSISSLVKIVNRRDRRPILKELLRKHGTLKVLLTCKTAILEKKNIALYNDLRGLLDTLETLFNKYTDIKPVKNIAASAFSTPKKQPGGPGSGTPGSGRK